MGTFEVKDNFYLNGEPFQIISGAVHYFRVLPEYWQDRLEKLKALGCNTVETYIPWNMIEPRKGEISFEGRNDIGRFIKTAQTLGLWVIVRPTPYICSEWDFGGLPAWLLAEDGMRFRTCYEPFLNHVREYYKELFQVLTPLQITQGGPILLFQVENEYGSYGDDKEYLNALAEMMVENGAEVPLITSDGPWGDMLSCGKTKGVLQTANFGSHAEDGFWQLECAIGNRPKMCTEFWAGWFDHWGEGHHKEDPKAQAQVLEDILTRGHVNIYPAHGGTSFGFMAGANYDAKLHPDVTSYDFDAAISEDGQLTEKFREFKKVIQKFRDVPDVTFSTKIERKAYGTLKVKEKAGLFEVLDDISTPTESTWTLPMEKLGQDYGYTLYRSELTYEKNVERIRLMQANDRAKIYVDEEPVATLYDKELLEEHFLETPAVGKKVDILMENMGRVNYGPLLPYQRKGIDGGVVINGHYHYQWKHYTLPLHNVDQIPFEKGYTEGKPAFYKFVLETETLADTFLDFEGFGKGVVFVNGFPLGRYWENGPQKRLYLPAPLLKQGENEIVLFETEGKAGDSITLYAESKLE